MDTTRLIDYYKHKEHIPKDECFEFDTVLSLLKNHYGDEYVHMLDAENRAGIDEVLTLYREFDESLNTAETRIRVIDAREDCLQEREWLFAGLAACEKREHVWADLELLAETAALSGTVQNQVQEQHIKEIADHYRVQPDEFKEWLKQKKISVQGTDTLKELFKLGIRALQEKIQAFFWVRLRFCTGKGSYPKVIWSSSRHKRYHLEILQENEKANQFAFILYSDEPLGSGQLIVKTKESELEKFIFENEKMRSHTFMYNGTIREITELYFIIKEL